MNKIKSILLLFLFLHFFELAHTQINEIVTSTINTRVFYAGLDNTLSVYPSDVSIQILEGDGTISKIDKGKYNLNFSTAGQCKLKVTSKYQTVNLYIPVRNVPYPKILFCGSSYGDKKREQFTQTDSLEISMDRFHFEGMSYSIKKFSVSIGKNNITTEDNKSKVLNFENNGPKFSLNLKNELMKLEPNDKLLFYDIELSSGQNNKSMIVNTAMSFIIE